MDTRTSIHCSVTKKNKSFQTTTLLKENKFLFFKKKLVTNTRGAMVLMIKQRVCLLWIGEIKTALHMKKMITIYDVLL